MGKFVPFVRIVFSSGNHSEMLMSKANYRNPSYSCDVCFILKKDIACRITQLHEPNLPFTLDIFK